MKYFVLRYYTTLCVCVCVCVLFLVDKTGEQTHYKRWHSLHLHGHQYSDIYLIKSILWVRHCHVNSIFWLLHSEWGQQQSNKHMWCIPVLVILLYTGIHLNRSMSEFLQHFATVTHSLRQSNCLATHTRTSGSKFTARFRRKDDWQHR